MRQTQLTKPPGSLGLLEEIAVRLAAMQGTQQPRLERVRIAGNGWVGWDGDLWDTEGDSNAGDMIFRRVVVEWNVADSAAVSLPGWMSNPAPRPRRHSTRWMGSRSKLFCPAHQPRRRLVADIKIARAVVVVVIGWVALERRV